MTTITNSFISVDENNIVVVANPTLPIVITECSICIEKYNKSKRLPVVCDFCQFQACRDCMKHYLLDSPENAHCMNCRKQWDLKTLVAKFDRNFIDKIYRVHRENRLIDKEKGLMVATQPIVEGLIRADTIEVELNTLHTEMRDLRIKALRLNNERINLLNYRNANNNPNDPDQQPTEKRHFVRKCTSEGCRGFLSSQWKCGICELWSCPECYEVKGPARDTEHTCHPDTLATAKLLQQDTKLCPSCGTGIFKIDGCFAANVPILTWDGNIKMSQDISIGDWLVGDDGTPRIVERTMTGYDEMYEVSQPGTTYIVNSKHKLVVKYKYEKHRLWVAEKQCWKIKWFDPEEMKICEHFFYGNSKKEGFDIASAFLQSLQQKYPDFTEIFVDAYMKLDPSIKAELEGVKRKDGIYYQPPESSLPLLLPSSSGKTQLPINPYTLGIWLTTPTILTDEKQKEIEAIYTKNYTKYYNDTIHVSMIPECYMKGSRYVRLSLLAGMIDVLGYYYKDKYHIRIVQTNKPMLSGQLIQLIRSVGYVVSYTVEDLACYKITIECVEQDDATGFQDLPTRLLNQQQYRVPPRTTLQTDGYDKERSGSRVVSKDTAIANSPVVFDETENYYDYDEIILHGKYSTTPITVKSVGFGSYFGWTLDGNHRFVLDDYTICKNCDQMYCMDCHTAFSWKTGKIETGNIHNPHYFEYMRKNGQVVERNNFEIRCGRELDHHFIVQFRRLITKHTNNSTRDKFYIRFQMYIERVRVIIHIRQVDLYRFTVNTVEENLQLRILYMRNRISEEEFKTRLQRKEKDIHKKQEYSNILGMFCNCSTEIMYRLVDYLNSTDAGSMETDTIDGFETEFQHLLEYTVQCLKDISVIYKCVVFPLGQKFAAIKEERFQERQRQRRIRMEEQEEVDY